MNLFKLQFKKMIKTYHVNVETSQIDNCKSQEEFIMLTSIKKKITYCYVCNVPLDFDNFIGFCFKHK